MSPSRRRFLRTTAPSISLASGCLSRFASGKHQFRKGGSIRTGEPLLTGAGIKSRTDYPYQYSALITDRKGAKRVRWDYFRDQDHAFAEKFAGVDFSQVFLTFAGVVLPESADLESDRSRFEKGQMESTYRVEGHDDLSAGTVIHTAVEHWDQNGEPPSKLSIYYRF